MKKLTAIIFLMVVLSMVVPVAAQDDIEEELPGCTAEDFEAALPIITAAITDYHAINEQIQQMTSLTQVGDLVEQVDSTQQIWWGVAVPKLPQCAFIQRITIMMGRQFDELLIALLMLETGRADLVTQHMTVIEDLNIEMADLGEAMKVK